MVELPKLVHKRSFGLSSAPAPSGWADPDYHRVLWLTLTLFLSYLCVAITLPVTSLYVITQLGLGNGAGGLAVGISFASTILTRGMAGRIADHRGSKHCMIDGLCVYALAGIVCGSASWPGLPTMVAYCVLIVGRLVLGVGESLTVVGLIAWCFGIMGPGRSGKVLALVGMGLFGAFAVGSPIGLALFNQAGYLSVMGACTLVPLLGLAIALPIAAVSPHLGGRQSFLSIIGDIWRLGLVFCLQGVGFAAIGAFMPLLFLHQGWSHAGLGLTCFGGAFVIVRILFGRLPDRLGGIPVAIASITVEVAGQALLWAAPSPAAAFAGAFLTGLGCSLIFPAMGTEMVRRIPPHLRGTANGRFSSIPGSRFWRDRPNYRLVGRPLWLWRRLSRRRTNRQSRSNTGYCYCQERSVAVHLRFRLVAVVA